jgi:hypothetical protein
MAMRNRKVIAFGLLAIAALLLVLWWTRYRVIGLTVNARVPIILDRFTGKFWVVYPDRAKEVMWERKGGGGVWDSQGVPKEEPKIAVPKG